MDISLIHRKSFPKIFNQIKNPKTQKSIRSAFTSPSKFGEATATWIQDSDDSFDG